MVSTFFVRKFKNCRVLQSTVVNQKNYCNLVKVQTLCILCNNWCLFVPRELMPELAWRPFKHSLGQVSSPEWDGPFCRYWQRQKNRVLESIFTIKCLLLREWSTHLCKNIGYLTAHIHLVVLCLIFLVSL
jgi:hypothetical protein